MTPLKIVKRPVAEYQIPRRSGSSAFVYHMELTGGCKARYHQSEHVGTHVRRNQD